MTVYACMALIFTGIGLFLSSHLVLVFMHDAVWRRNPDDDSIRPGAMRRGWRIAPEPKVMGRFRSYYPKSLLLIAWRILCWGGVTLAIVGIFTMPSDRATVVTVADSDG